MASGAQEDREQQFASGTAPAARPLSGIERMAAEQQALDAMFYRASEAWRDEVADRVSSYRKRRKKFDPESTPRLDFEAQRQANRMALVQEAVAEQAMRFEAENLVRAVPEAEPEPPPQPVKPPTRVLVFPHPPDLPPPQLAEPVIEPPRILEAPELPFEPLPPAAPPPLPTILLEEEAPLTRPESELELPIRVASLTQRGFAAGIDMAIVAIALATFYVIAVKIAGPIASSKFAIPAFGVAGAILWAGYSILMLTQAGATPGMTVARLELRTFEGEALKLSARKARALSLLISFLPLGLGFAWAFLDEDTLCWHDRISRTCLVERS